MSNTLPFWFDDLELFYYLPEHTLITLQQAYTDFGITSTEIMQCKAWWNTNIPMDHFVPTLIPCDNQDAGVNACLWNFSERVKQRADGKMVPTPPILNIKLGLVILIKESLEPYAFVCQLPGEDEAGILRIIVANDDPKNVGTYMSLGSKTYISGEVIKRDPMHLYWNMFEGRYV